MRYRFFPEENKYFEVRRTYPHSRKLPKCVYHVIRMSRKPPDVHSDLPETLPHRFLNAIFFRGCVYHIFCNLIFYIQTLLLLLEVEMSNLKYVRIFNSLRLNVQNNNTTPLQNVKYPANFYLRSLKVTMARKINCAGGKNVTI